MRGRVDVFRWFLGIILVVVLALYYVGVDVQATADDRPQDVVNPVLTDAPNQTAKISPFFIDLNSVHKIICPLNARYDSIGTGEVIDTNTIVTAHHVVGHNAYCWIEGHRAKVVYNNATLDFAVLDFPTGKEPRFPISCTGAKTGHVYYVIGHANGTQLAVTKLMALPDYENSHDEEDGQPFLHVRRFRGTAYHGQSGGPVVDENGVEIGELVAAGQDDDGDTADVREFHDTYICQDALNRERADLDNAAKNYRRGGIRLPPR
jgi:hypothetical protein